MFDIKRDIQAMTTFRRNPGKFEASQKDEETARSYNQWQGGGRVAPVPTNNGLAFVFKTNGERTSLP
jgi:hypothetical protein